MHDSFVGAAGLMLAHILPTHDRSTDVHVQGADDSELRDLDAHIYHTQVLGRDAFFLLVTGRNIKATCKLMLASISRTRLWTSLDVKLSS